MVELLTCFMTPNKLAQLEEKPIAEIVVEMQNKFASHLSYRYQYD